VNNNTDNPVKQPRAAQRYPTVHRAGASRASLFVACANEAAMWNNLRFSTDVEQRKAELEAVRNWRQALLISEDECAANKALYDTCKARWGRPIVRVTEDENIRAFFVHGVKGVNGSYIWINVLSPTQLQWRVLVWAGSERCDTEYIVWSAASAKMLIDWRFPADRSEPSATPPDGVFVHEMSVFPEVLP
jgi:hypothetical protein